MERAAPNRSQCREDGLRFASGERDNKLDIPVRGRLPGHRPPHKYRDHMDKITALYWRHKHWCWACSIITGVAAGAAVAWFVFGHESVPARLLCEIWTCVLP
jgi:hypothetical protein